MVKLREYTLAAALTRSEAMVAAETATEEAYVLQTVAAMCLAL